VRLAVQQSLIPKISKDGVASVLDILKEQMNHDSPKVKESVIKVFGRLPEGKLIEVAPEVVQMLDDRDRDVRIAAVEVLDLLPLKALVEVGPGLVQRMRDPQSTAIGRQLKQLLEKMTKEAWWKDTKEAWCLALRKVVKALMLKLEESETQGNNAISTGLTEALLEILVKFPSAELALVATELIDHHLSSKDGDVRWGVLKVCWKLPADILAKSAPIMIAALSDSNADARRVAGKIVWKLPVDSLAQMLPQLLEALRKTTTSSDIRKEMTRLMFAPDRLPVQAVVDEIDVLIDWLEDPDAEIRHLAGDIIGRLPERDIIELVPDLTLMIDTYKDSNFKNAPLEILAKLPPKKLAQLAPDHAKMITFKHRNGSSKLGNRPNYLSLPELGPTHRNASQSRSTSAQN